MTSFERKRYLGLARANKAMNLNAYLSLVGCRLDEAPARSPRPLAGEAPVPFAVADAEYVVTLDADSTCSRLRACAW